MRSAQLFAHVVQARRIECVDAFAERRFRPAAPGTRRPERDRLRVRDQLRERREQHLQRSGRLERAIAVGRKQSALAERLRSIEAVEVIVFVGDAEREFGVI